MIEKLEKINNDIEVSFCTRQQSLKLKELGFDSYCSYFYTDSGKIKYGFKNNVDDITSYYIKNSDITVLNYCTAPTQEQAIKWILLNYHIFIVPKITHINNNYIKYKANFISVDTIYNPLEYLEHDVSKEYDSVEKCIEVALNFILKIKT